MKKPDERKSRDFQLVMNFLLKTNLKDILKDYGKEDFQLTFIIYNIAKKVEYKKVLKGEIIFRIGDLGDKFFLILKGSVSVLKPIDTEIYCSLEEYIGLLKKLKEDKERYITEHIIKLNKKKFYVEYEKIEEAINIIFRKKLLKYLKLHYSVEEIKALFIKYNQRVENFDINFQLLKKYEDAGKKNAIIDELQNSYNYMLIAKNFQLDLNVVKSCSFEKLCDKIDAGYKIKLEDLEVRSIYLIMKYEDFTLLSTGKYFGDFAIDCNLPRTATVMGLDEETHLAIIDKECYKEFILKHKLRIEEKKINLIYKSLFSKFITKNYFEKKYYGNFVYQEFGKGHVLYKESQNLECIYVIQSGKVTLSLKKNFYNLAKIINDASTLDVTIKKLYEERIKKLDKGNGLIFEILNNFFKVQNTNSLNSPNGAGEAVKFINSLLNNDQKKIEKLNELKNLSIAEISDNDIIGLENFLFKMPTQYNATVTSEKVCCYTINVKELEKIRDNEDQTMQVMEDIAIKKLLSLILRLAELSKTFLDVIKLEEIYNKKASFSSSPSKSPLKRNISLNFDNVSSKQASKNDFETFKLEEDKEAKLLLFTKIPNTGSTSSRSYSNLHILQGNNMEKIEENAKEHQNSISDDSYFIKADDSTNTNFHYYNQKNISSSKKYNPDQSPSFSLDNLGVLKKENSLIQLRCKEINNDGSSNKKNSNNNFNFSSIESYNENKPFDSLDLISTGNKTIKSDKIKKSIFNRGSIGTNINTNYNNEISPIEQFGKVSSVISFLDKDKEKLNQMRKNSLDIISNKDSFDLEQEGFLENKNILNTHEKKQENFTYQDNLRVNEKCFTQTNFINNNVNKCKGFDSDSIKIEANDLSKNIKNINLNNITNLNTKINNKILNMNKVNIVKMLETNYDKYKIKFLKNKFLYIQKADESKIANDKTKNDANINSPTTKTSNNYSNDPLILSHIMHKYGSNKFPIKENNSTVTELLDENNDNNCNYKNINSSNCNSPKNIFNKNKKILNTIIGNKFKTQIMRKSFIEQKNINNKINNNPSQSVAVDNLNNKDSSNAFLTEYGVADKNSLIDDTSLLFMDKKEKSIENHSIESYKLSKMNRNIKPIVNNTNSNNSKNTKIPRRISRLINSKNNISQNYNEFNLLDLQNPYKNMKLESTFLHSGLNTVPDKARDLSINSFAPGSTKKTLHSRNNHHSINNSRLNSLYLSNMTCNSQNSPLLRDCYTDRSPNIKTFTELKSKIDNYQSFLRENKIKMINGKAANGSENQSNLKSSTSLNSKISKKLKSIKSYSTKSPNGSKPIDRSDVYFQEINLKGDFEFFLLKKNENNNKQSVFKRALNHLPNDIKKLRFKKTIKKNSVITKNS